MLDCSMLTIIRHILVQVVPINITTWWPAKQATTNLSKNHIKSYQNLKACQYEIRFFVKLKCQTLFSLSFKYFMRELISVISIFSCFQLRFYHTLIVPTSHASSTVMTQINSRIEYLIKHWNLWKVVWWYSHRILNTIDDNSVFAYFLGQHT